MFFKCVARSSVVDAEEEKDPLKIHCIWPGNFRDVVKAGVTARTTFNLAKLYFLVPYRSMYQ